jgi:hypothetical protein
MISPVHARVAIILVTAIEDMSALTSVLTWGRAIGTSGSTITSRCRAAGLKTRVALDFRRGLTAVVLSAATGVCPADLLGFVDPRTIRDFVGRCGPLRSADRVWTPLEYCRLQRILNNAKVVEAVGTLLRERGFAD